MSAALQQGTPEWLDLRRTKIGASDAPTIMSVSPWMTPYQLWEYKVGLRAPQAENDAMRRGRNMEDTARRQFEKNTGIIVFPAVLFHRDHDWMMASLDGIDIEHTTLVEIKCPGREDHQKAMDGRVPEKYYPQLQHQMAVCDLPQAIYYSYTDYCDASVVVKRDDEYIERLITAEQSFWCGVENLDPPTLADRDYVTHNDDIWRATTERWKRAHIMLKAAEEEEAEMRRALISMADGCNSRGNGVRLLRGMRRGNVDYRSIPEIQGLSLETYRKPPSEFWRVSYE